MKFLVFTMCVYVAAAASSLVDAGIIVAPGHLSSPGGLRGAPKVRRSVDSEIISYNSNVGTDGFNYAFENSDGSAAKAVGVLKKVDSVESIDVKGSYRYTAPDGTPVEIEYTADENGYHPVGSSIPVSPPSPDYIVRALEYIAAHPQPVAKF